MGFGGSTGGGGSSGSVDWPSYFKDVHYSMLCATGGSSLSPSWTEWANWATHANPFEAVTIYSPDTALNNMVEYVNTYADLVDSILWTDVSTLMSTATTFVDTNLLSDSYITQDSEAFDDLVDLKVTTDSLPRFQRGMQELNAVQSSSYVIGKSLIETAANMEKARYLAGLKTSLAAQRLNVITGMVNQMGQFYLARTEASRAWAAMGIEAQRLAVVAKKEETDQVSRNTEAHRRWPMEVIQYGANLLAAGHGGTASPKPNEVNPGISAMGGALSGAAAGASLASVAGLSATPAGWALMGVGAVVGGIAGLLS